MSTETKPKVLVVYFSLTRQSARVAEAMTQALAARGCGVAKACIEFTDERFCGPTGTVRTVRGELPCVARRFVGVAQ